MACGTACCYVKDALSFKVTLTMGRMPQVKMQQAGTAGPELMDRLLGVYVALNARQTPPTSRHSLVNVFCEYVVNLCARVRWELCCVGLTRVLARWLSHLASIHVQRHQSTLA